MSEEEVEVAEVPEEAAVEEAVVDENPIFNALFKAVESEPEDEGEPQEVAPTSLQSALHDIELGDTPEEPTEEPTEESESTEVKDAKPVKKKKKVARKPNIIDPLPHSQSQPSIPAPPAKEDPFVATLSAEERERYDLASWASRNLPESKGLDGRYLNFFKNHKKYIDKRLADDPDVELESDEGYQRFISENKPTANVKELEHARISSVAEAKAMEKMAPEIARLDRQQRVMQGTPIANQRFEGAKGHFRNAIPKDIHEEFSKDPLKFSESRPFETKIVNGVLDDAFAMAQSFYNILHDVEEYNEQNASHVALSQWIDKEQTDFINTGKTKKDGKVFIRRERFPSLPEQDRSGYYTFNDDDVIRLLALRVNQSISKKLNHLNESLSSAGYTRGGAAATEAPKPQADTPTPRPIQPSQRPGPAPAAPAAKEGNSILSLLDI